MYGTSSTINRESLPPHFLKFYFVGNELLSPVRQLDGPTDGGVTDNALHIRIHFVLVLAEIHKIICQLGTYILVKNTVPLPFGTYSYYVIHPLPYSCTRYR